ncbi:hypothetical protein [Paludisphaera borealis]|uniref:RNHCP domain-containing protein n=1 Tax=Paludisphaera borealis TaxID=1387353 RepID=A0A1U7CZ45_9BACT|nr:hypothetical protein [Paludisphaera borealis]APW64163.1 hypothetical protein BSF38_05755 [Paludisphaera borealis]
MARSRMILPAPDPTCRRLFHADRLTAEGHRVALEIWIRATGRECEGTRVIVYRCKRCAGFHITRKRIAPKSTFLGPPAELVEIPPEPNLILGL